MARSRRRTFFVGGAQRKLLALHLVYHAAFTLVLVAALVIPLVTDVLDGADSPAQRAAATRALLYLHARVVPLLGVLLVVWIAHSVVTTHRIAGPFVRLRSAFALVGRGSLSRRLRIRRGDLLHDEVEEFNRMLDALAERLRGVEARVDSVEAAAQAVARATEANGSAEVRGRVASLRDALDDLRSEWADLDLGDEPPAAGHDDVDTAPSLAAQLEEHGAEHHPTPRGAG